MEYQGAKDRKGYGVTRRGKAHRLAWTLTHGPIPAGMFVCHRCDNPPCCNPAHLFLGTARDNVSDMLAKGRGWTKQPARVVGEDAVLRIREEYRRGLGASLARKYGITERAVMMIVRGKIYKDVGGPIQSGCLRPRRERSVAEVEAA